MHAPGTTTTPLRASWDLWLDCWTQQAIAGELGVAQPTVNSWLSGIQQHWVPDSPPESRQHFDVWAFGAVELEPLYAEQAKARQAQAPGKPRGTKASSASVSADRREETARQRKSAEQAGKEMHVSGRSVGSYRR